MKEETKKKIIINSEATYIVAILLLSLSVAMLTTADFGISMIVAPAYLLSLKVNFLTFGQAEYVIQAIFFILLCLVIRKFKPIYLTSFMTCLIYGLALDLWRMIPFFNSSVTSPESLALWIRILLFIGGVLLTGFSVALFFKTYFYPQVYDFSVKCITARYRFKMFIVKTGVDFSMLGIALIMTFCFFGKLVGIGWGTLVMAVLNGTIIGLFSKLLDHCFEFKPALSKFASFFDLGFEAKEKGGNPSIE